MLCAMSGIIGGLGAALVLTLLMRAGRRTAATVDVSSGARVARYPAAARFLAWFLLFVTLAASGFVFTKIPTTRGMAIGALICSAVVAAVVSLLLEFTRIRASWTSKQIELSSPLDRQTRARLERPRRSAVLTEHELVCAPRAHWDDRPPVRVARRLERVARRAAGAGRSRASAAGR